MWSGCLVLYYVVGPMVQYSPTFLGPTDLLRVRCLGGCAPHTWSTQTYVKKDRLSLNLVQELQPRAFVMIIAVCPPDYLLPLARLCVWQSMVRLARLVDPPFDQAVTWSASISLSL